MAHKNQAFSDQFTVDCISLFENNDLSCFNFILDVFSIAAHQSFQTDLLYVQIPDVTINLRKNYLEVLQ